MMNTKDDIIEEIKSEVVDDYSDDSLFNISSWGADLSFREIISMYEEDELVKPELQRKYVWDKVEASRFVESILMGLPVPSIFLAQSGSQKLIVDGYQRIMTVNDYVRGIPTTKNEKNVCVISGYSPNVFKNILTMEEYSPIEEMITSLKPYMDLIKED